MFTPDAPVVNRLMDRINASLNKARDLFTEITELGDVTGLKELNLIRNNRKFLEV